MAAICWRRPSLRAQEPTLDVVLARAAAYVARYQRSSAGSSPRRHYRQNVMSTASGRDDRARRTRAAIREGRELKSDLLLVKLGDENFWMQFRDVFEVDRKPIRDRDQRLYKLFVEAKTDARAQAETHPAGKRALQPRPDHADDQRADHGAAVSRAKRAAGASRSSRARPATSSASKASPTPTRSG